MKTILIIGANVVTLALIAYSIAIITEQRRRVITPFILQFLTIGLILDITATVLMIIGSSNSPFTFHGFVGYSALAFMLVETSLVWKFKINNGYNLPVSKGLHIFTLIAYIWWVAAYITGALLVVFK